MAGMCKINTIANIIAIINIIVRSADIFFIKFIFKPYFSWLLSEPENVFVYTSQVLSTITSISNKTLMRGKTLSQSSSIILHNEGFFLNIASPNPNISALKSF